MDESRGLPRPHCPYPVLRSRNLHIIDPRFGPGVSMDNETSSGSGREKHDLWSRKQSVGLAGQPIGDEADPFLRGPVELDQS